MKSNAMILGIIASVGHEAVLARLNALGFKTRSLAVEEIVELVRHSPVHLACVVPEAALHGERWAALRLALSRANRNFIVFGSELKSSQITHALREGAFDVLVGEDTVARCESAFRELLQAQEVLHPLGAAAMDRLESPMIGVSPVFTRLRQAVARLGPTGATVLIEGESGSGKEVVAQSVHEASGRPRFVAVNCAAIPRDLLEAELFGSEKGAFTGAVRSRPGLVEQARLGTLFLDEIGELDLSLQPKLLRFLETGRARRVGGVREYEASVRIIAATNVQLDTAVARHRFRADLYYRLSEFSLRVPPLRERQEDIEPLAKAFARAAAIRFGKEVTGLHPELLLAFHNHAWPGNVRELKHAVDRMVLMCDGPVLLPEWWTPPSVPGPVSGIAHWPLAEDRAQGPPAGPNPLGFPSAVRKRQMAAELLQQNHQSVATIAARLGVHVSTLYRWRKKAST